MARRRGKTRRERIPDPKYNSELITKVINYVMRKGKKSTSERIVYGAIDHIREKMKDSDPIEVLVKAVDNIKPRVEVRSRRVGGATYQVPVEISPDRQMALALRWLITYASARKGMPMGKAVAQELLDAYQNQGNAIKKRDDTHKMAQANKVFAHYAW